VAKYDIFICCKKTTDDGAITDDYAVASDICHTLKNDEYTVFFAEPYRDDKHDQSYIFNAINNAKAMLVFGTRKEYFESEEVKREWEAFLNVMKNDKSRLLIPCYKDMDHDDIPDKLSNLRCYDISSDYTPILDILNRIKEVLEADDFAKKVPSGTPANATYISKLCAELNVQREEDLGNLEYSIADKPNFQKAVRFSGTADRARLNGYEEKIQQRIRQKKYDILLYALNNASTEKEWKDLAGCFRALGYHDDANRCEFECEKLKRARQERYDGAVQAMDKASTEEDWENLAKTFKAFGNYNDAVRLATLCDIKHEGLTTLRIKRAKLMRTLMIVCGFLLGGIVGGSLSGCLSFFIPSVILAKNFTILFLMALCLPILLNFIRAFIGFFSKRLADKPRQGWNRFIPLWIFFVSVICAAGALCFYLGISVGVVLGAWIGGYIGSGKIHQGQLP